MKPRFSMQAGLPGNGVRERGSTFIIVLWIAFGLVSLALYFASSMSFELRASDNRVSALAADEAIDGAARYITSMLGNLGTNGLVPDVTTYSNAAVPVGESHFWLIGRDTNNPVSAGRLCFGLVPENSKLNLNTVRSNQLIWLPRMTLDLAGAILDWRGSSNGPGTSLSSYAMSQPAYQCKGAPFETVDELRLVEGSYMDILVGEDANRNGVLDPDENDDNKNGMLDPGLLEYVTVYSREPNPSTNSDGETRINISSFTGTSSATTQLRSLLSTNFGATRAAEIIQALGLPSATTSVGTGRGTSAATTTTTVRFTSPLQFYVRSKMTVDEFAEIAGDIMMTSTNLIKGRVNVNMASAPVLACLLGGDLDAAQAMVDYRSANSGDLTSIAWVSDALQNYPDALTALEAGDYITTQSYQFTADVAALGPNGRGYRRVKFVFDTSSGTPQIIYRQDLSHLGWALGNNVRQTWLLAKGTQ
jgi:type II secretory pathway component PulK